MTNSRTALDDFDYKADDILSILNLLNIICQIDDFKLRLKSNKNNISRFLPGYQFAFHVISRRLYDVISQNSSLKLSEDLLFNRADSKGIEIHLLPNSCEKIILLKLLKSHFKDVLSANTWPDTKKQIIKFYQQIVLPLQKLKSISSIVKKESLKSINIDELINYCSINEIVIFLNDTRRGLPHGYPVPTLNSEMWDNPSAKQQYLRKVFAGYKHSVLFIWSKILNRELVSEYFRSLSKTTSWEAFDDHFKVMAKETLDPVEQKLQVSLGVLPVIIISGNTRPIIEPLLQTKPYVSPLNEREKLEQLFLWYQIQIIDCSDYSRFNGLPTLLPLLAGIKQKNQQINDFNKITVIKLIHYYSRQGNDYSYAVFMDSQNTQPGWILFLHCCYDYTGTGLGPYRRFEKLLFKYREEHLINTVEFSVDTDVFLKSMESYYVTYPIRLDLLRTRERLDTGRGLSLELLTYFYLDCKYSNAQKKDWNYSLGKINIDVLLKLTDTLIYVECKLPTNNLTEEAKKLKTNSARIENLIKFKNEWSPQTCHHRKYIFSLWNKPEESISQQLYDLGIDLLIMSEIFGKQLLNKNQDKKLNHLFNSNTSPEDN